MMRLLPSLISKVAQLAANFVLCFQAGKTETSLRETWKSSRHKSPPTTRPSVFAEEEALANLVKKELKEAYASLEAHKSN
jgi:hypothetical protein